MEADRQYLEYARKLALYGVDLHEARVSRERKIKNIMTAFVSDQHVPVL